jgi:hypothetical protein
MKIFTAVFGVAVLASGLAFAQSSGNFSATGTGASCEIGGGGVLSGGTALTSFTANISTGSGSGTTLDIRPDLVTGLFTDTKISTTVPTSSADVGIQVCVTVDNSTAGIFPASCVTYDQRFQQISSQLFSQLTACTLAPTTDVCSSTTACPVATETCQLGTTGTCTISSAACSAAAPCAAGAGTCNLTGACLGPNPLCNFDLILSTLSAHSFDFVVQVDNKKPHVVAASWKTIGAGVIGSGTVASCVGPGILSVTQVKVFNNSGALTF